MYSFFLQYKIKNENKNLCQEVLELKSVPDKKKGVQYNIVSENNVYFCNNLYLRF